MSDIKHPPINWTVAPDELAKLSHEDRCRFHDDEVLCSCGAGFASIAEQWKARADELLEALTALENVAASSLDHRPEFRRAISKAHSAIVKPIGVQS